MYQVKFKKTFVSGNLKGLVYDDALSAVDINHAEVYFRMYKEAEKNELVYNGYGNTSSYIVSDIHIVAKG